MPEVAGEDLEASGELGTDDLALPPPVDPSPRASSSSGCRRSTDPQMGRDWGGAAHMDSPVVPIQALHHTLHSGPRSSADRIERCVVCRMRRAAATGSAHPSSRSRRASRRCRGRQAGTAKLARPVRTGDGYEPRSPRTSPRTPRNRSSPTTPPARCDDTTTRLTYTAAPAPRTSPKSTCRRRDWSSRPIGTPYPLRKTGTLCRNRS